MSKIVCEASLVEAGYLDGSTVKVAIDPEDLWKALDSKALADEVHERIALADPVILGLADDIGPDEGSCPEDETEPLFRDLGDWDRVELLRAVREDDGRRALELLRRHAA